LGQTGRFPSLTSPAWTRSYAKLFPKNWTN